MDYLLLVILIFFYSIFNLILYKFLLKKLNKIEDTILFKPILKKVKFTKN